VHLYDPHFPYQEHTDEFGDAFAQRPYDAELAFVDGQVQRLMGFLKTNGITDDTVVMVVGDHGEGLGDHQELMHGYMLYNSTLHVPWLASWPGHIPSNTVVPAPVSLVDLLPTSLDWLQIQPPKGTTGRSLKALVAGENIEPSPCYAETDDPRLDSGWCGLQTILTPEWKYIRTADPELFRVADDAEELRNLAAAEPGQVQAMDRQLLDFLAGLMPRKTDRANLSSRDMRVLAGLGYTAGQASSKPSSGDLRGPDVKVMIPHFNRVVKATHLMEAGKFSDAEPLLRQTVEAVPDYVIAWETLGRCLARQNRFDEARACFQRMLDLDAEDTRALFHLAAADLAERRIDEATDRLQQVLKIDPASADAWFYLAGASVQAGKMDDAQSHFMKALTCDPEHVGALQGLGDFHFERQEFDHAIEYYTAVNRLDPYLPGPFVNRGIALGQLGDLDAAVRFFNDGLEHSPADPLLHSNLGFALQQQRRYGDAINHYERALSVAADEPQALVNLSLLLSTAPDPKLRDGQRALELASRAVEASAGVSTEALISLAAANAELGRFDEAVARIESALRSPQLTAEQQSLLQRQATLYGSRSPYRLTQ
jgi:pentatricopeptide repeat protein